MRNPLTLRTVSRKGCVMLDEMGKRPRGHPDGRFFMPVRQEAPGERQRHEAATRMILITRDDRRSGLTTSIDALEQQLADMREDLQALSLRIRAGEIDELKNATRATAEIRQWLKIAIEAEVQLDKRRQQDLGIVHGYGFDFDAARTEIGCRLDRLRRTRCAGRLPRCPQRG